MMMLQKQYSNQDKTKSLEKEKICNSFMNSKSMQKKVIQTSKVQNDAQIKMQTTQKEKPER